MQPSSSTFGTLSRLFSATMGRPGTFTSQSGVMEAGDACSTGSVSPDRVVGASRARSPGKKVTPNPTPKQRPRTEEGDQGTELFKE